MGSQQTCEKGRPLTKFIGHGWPESLWCGKAEARGARRGQWRKSMLDAGARFGSFKESVKWHAGVGRGEIERWRGGHRVRCPGAERYIRTPPTWGGNSSCKRRRSRLGPGWRTAALESRGSRTLVAWGDRSVTPGCGGSRGGCGLAVGPGSAIGRCGARWRARSRCRTRSGRGALNRSGRSRWGSWRSVNGSVDPAGLPRMQSLFLRAG
jgi:hypothetical protein